MRARALFPILLLLARSATADPEEARNVRELFDDARLLMTRGDYETASTRLASAAALSKGRGIRYQLAVCYEKLGRVASAWALYLEVAEASRDAREPDRERVARTHAAELAPRVSYLRVWATNADLRIERDHVALASSSWNAPLAVDAGHHVVHVERPGYRAWDRDVDVAEGLTVDVRVPELEAIVEDKPPPPPPVVVVRTSPRLPRVLPSRPSAMRTAGALASGAGLVAIATGAAFAIASVATYASTSSLCDATEHCTPRGSAIRGDALTYGDVATALVIGGSVALATGLVVWILAPKRARTLAWVPVVRF